MMKERATYFDSQRRPHWWLALLSLFVATSFMLSPINPCAPMDTATGRAHPDGHSHEFPAVHHHSVDEEVEMVGHHNDHSYVEKAHLAPLQPAPHKHSCCSSTTARPVIVAAASRFRALDAGTRHITFAPAALALPTPIFVVTSCHGRDGPWNETLHSQLCRASLSGRAPPVSL